MTGIVPDNTPTLYEFAGTTIGGQSLYECIDCGATVREGLWHRHQSFHQTIVDWQVQVTRQQAEEQARVNQAVEARLTLPGANPTPGGVVDDKAIPVEVREEQVNGPA